MGFSRPEKVREALANFGIRWPVCHPPPNIPLGFDYIGGHTMHFSSVLTPRRAKDEFLFRQAITSTGHPKAFLWTQPNRLPILYRREVYITD